MANERQQSRGGKTSERDPDGEPPDNEVQRLQQAVGDLLGKGSEIYEWHTDIQAENMEGGLPPYLPT